MFLSGYYYFYKAKTIIILLSTSFNAPKKVGASSLVLWEYVQAIVTVSGGCFVSVFVEAEF